MINKINRSISYILIAILGSVARVHTGYPGCSSDTYNSLSQEQQDECINRVLGLLEQCPIINQLDLKCVIVSQLYTTFSQRSFHFITPIALRTLYEILDGRLILDRYDSFDREIRQFLVELVNGRPCQPDMVDVDRALGYTTVVPFLEDYLYTVKPETTFSRNRMLALLRLIKSPFHMCKGSEEYPCISPDYPIRLYFIILMVKDFGNITQIKPLQEIKALLMGFLIESFPPNYVDFMIDSFQPEERVQDTNLLKALSFLRKKIIPMRRPYTGEFEERLQCIKDFMDQLNITDHLNTLHFFLNEMASLAPVSHAIRACLPSYQTNPPSEAASSRDTDGQSGEATGSTSPSVPPLPPSPSTPHLTLADLPPQVLQQILSNLTSMGAKCIVPTPNHE